jgi:hypothetical protein
VINAEPRVKIIDGDGTSNTFSNVGQQALEKQNGKQIPIYLKLELHQSSVT